MSIINFNYYLFGNLLESLISDWLQDQPQIVWSVTHPLLSIGIVFLIFFLFWGLLKAITSLIEKMWMLLLKAPFILMKFLVKLWFPSYKNIPGSTPKNLTGQELQNRSQIIVHRLEELKIEQDALLKELKTILEGEES